MTAPCGCEPSTMLAGGVATPADPAAVADAVLARCSRASELSAAGLRVLVTVDRVCATEPSHTLLTVLHPHFVVTRRGEVFRVADADFATLLTLVDAATSLPDTGTFLNTWTLAEDPSNRLQPILKIQNFDQGEDGAPRRRIVSVANWGPGREPQLEAPQAGFETLPPAIIALCESLEVLAHGLAGGDAAKRAPVAGANVALRKTAALTEAAVKAAWDAECAREALKGKSDVAGSGQPTDMLTSDIDLDIPEGED